MKKSRQLLGCNNASNDQNNANDTTLTTMPLTTENIELLGLNSNFENPQTNRIDSNAIDRNSVDNDDNKCNIANNVTNKNGVDCDGNSFDLEDNVVNQSPESKAANKMFNNSSNGINLQGGADSDDTTVAYSHCDSGRDTSGQSGSLCDTALSIADTLMSSEEESNHNDADVNNNVNFNQYFSLTQSRQDLPENNTNHNAMDNNKDVINYPMDQNDFNAIINSTQYESKPTNEKIKLTMMPNYRERDEEVTARKKREAAMKTRLLTNSKALNDLELMPIVKLPISKPRSNFFNNLKLEDVSKDCEKSIVLLKQARKKIDQRVLFPIKKKYVRIIKPFRPFCKIRYIKKPGHLRLDF